MRQYSLGAVGLLFLASPAFALDSETRVTITGNFAENEDVSGIACAEPIGTFPRNCLVAVDEDVKVQRVVLTREDGGYVLEPGERLTVLDNDDKKVEKPYFGTPPTTACSAGVKDAEELDGEAVTFAAGAYYIAGSHGCGRNNQAARLSGFLVARLAPDAAAGNDPAGEISFRLNEVLASDAALASHFGKDLAAGGISIEGLAGTGDPARLYFGLRSPTDGSNAYIVSVDAAALFSDDANLAAQVDRIDLSELGTGLGIRDIATVESDTDRLLLLFGPALGDEGKYFVADYNLTTRKLGPEEAVSTPPDGKAEGLLIVDRLSTKAKVLFLYDGVKDGAPAMKIVALQQ